MDPESNPSAINLDNLTRLARGDNQKMFKYLDQFRVLVPERMEQLTKSLQTMDRNQIRQILHEMSPQLQFFGVEKALVLIRQLVEEYQTMDWEELKEMADSILENLKEACEAVKKALDQK